MEVTVNTKYRILEYYPESCRKEIRISICYVSWYVFQSSNKITTSWFSQTNELTVNGITFIRANRTVVDNWRTTANRTTCSNQRTSSSIIVFLCRRRPPPPPHPPPRERYANDAYPITRIFALASVFVTHCQLSSLRKSLSLFLYIVFPSSFILPPIVVVVSSVASNLCHPSSTSVNLC